MSKGTFNITVKSGDFSYYQGKYDELHPYIQILFGSQTKCTTPAQKEGFQPAWNVNFAFKKNMEYRLEISVLTQEKEGKEILLGSQEMGINTFVKKRNTVDHMVELLKDGVNVGEVLLNIEFIPEESSEKQWQTVNIKKKPSEIHKLLLSKMKATLEYEENHINVFSNNNPCLRVCLGRRQWMTQESAFPAGNLQWTENFKIVIQNEQEVYLELIVKDYSDQETKLGSAILKLKQFKQGSSPNKVPITLEGKQKGYFYFQSDYEVPQIKSVPSTPRELVSPPTSLAKPPKAGTLVINLVRLYLEKSNVVDDGFIQFGWGEHGEKTEVQKGKQNKIEWKDPITFKKQSFEPKLEVMLLDKKANKEEEPFGFGVFFLEPAPSETTNYRSQKIDLFSNDHLIGQVYIDYEYITETKSFQETKNDPLDMKRITSPQPSKEDLKKKDLIQKRKDLMKSTIDEEDREDKYLPSIDESSNYKQNASIQHPPQLNRVLKSTPAVKSVHIFSLPRIKHEIRIKEYNKIYKDSVFGLGMSNLHSASSLRHSVPAFSLPKSERFPSQRERVYRSLHLQAPSFFEEGNAPYQYNKNKIYSKDFRYQIFHKSPTQKAGVSFGQGERFKESKKVDSQIYYQSPQVLNYKL